MHHLNIVSTHNTPSPNGWYAMTTTEHTVNNGRVSADTFLIEETGPQTNSNHAPEATVDNPVDTNRTPPPAIAPSADKSNRVPRMGFPGFAYRITRGRWVLPLTKPDTESYEREEAEAAAQAAADAAAEAAAQAAAEAAVRAKAEPDAQAAAEAQRLDQEQSDRDEYQLLLEEKNVQVNQKRKQTDTVANVKGGAGKSPVACNYATVKGSVTGRVTTVIDNNPNWGTAAMLLGVDPSETVTVRMMNEAILADKVTSFDEFSAPLGWNRFHVQLVASDALARRESYGYNVAKNVIKTGKTNSIFVVVDTGNEISDSAMRATLELSDLLIVPTLTTHAKLEGAVHTMENFRNWGHEALVRHSIVVVCGLRPGDSAENYRKELGLGDDHVLMGIPFDDRIHNDMVVDLRKMPQETYIAFLELVLACSQVGKYVETHGADSPPLQLKQGQMVPLSSGRTPVLSYVSSNQSARS